MPITQSMIIDVAVLLGALVLILASSEFFTNGVEWLGQKLGLSEGVVGSVLAAVGTALPETLIPVVAVVFFGTSGAFEVGIGAIAGAPFMLTTLTLGLCGMSMWYFARQGKRPAEITANAAVIGRDLRFFIVVYAVGLLCAFVDDYFLPIRYIVAALLMVVYAIYLKRTFAHVGEVGEAPETLHLDRMLKLGTGLVSVWVQVLVGLSGILGGAYLFVDHVQSLAADLGVPQVILSLIIAPIATELPEKVNSILWSRQGKDTLALGNITGALVFQSCFPVAIGLAFTPWDLGPATFASGVVAIVSASVWLALLKSQQLKPAYLAIGALVYGSMMAWLVITHRTS